MPRWQPYDVVGGAYSDDTRPWSVQDTVNYLVVNAERPGGRSSKMLRGVPGMVTFSASMPESSVRGLYVAEGRLFAVVGTTLYSIGTTGAATSLGTIPGVGRCVFTHNQITNGNQVVIGNGQSGYVYDTVAGTLTQITDEGFPGFRSVDFHDQYVIGVEPFGRYWFHSDLADATSYNALDRAEAEKAPDRIMQAISTGPDVFVLGERTGQFFYNTGAATGTFANRSGAEMDVGAASPWTACRLDNTVYWLGSDGSVYRLNGYVPQRISTHALEQAISRCTLSDAYAFTFEDRGHKCYLLTFPDGKTWCFDAATQEWTRRESYGFDRWRVSALVKWGRNWIAGDFINGKLYQLDWAVQQEAGEVLEPRRVCGVLHDDQNRMIVNALELVFDTGMDADSAPLPQPILEPLVITGDMASGTVGDAVSLTYSTSGGLLPYGDRTITSGSLPPGLSMSAAGVVTGSLTTPGDYTWTVSVTDANGDTATVMDSVTVSFVDVTWYASVAASNYAYGRSPDGNDWTEATRSGGTFAATTSAVGFALGRLYVIAQATGVCTLDESTFTSLTGLTITGGAKTVVEVAGKAVLIGTETAKSGTSSNGTAFSTVTHSVSRTLYGHGLKGGTLVVGATNGYIQRCTDGVTFADVSLFGGFGEVQVCAGRDHFYAHSSGVAKRSTDGVTWVSATSPYVGVANGFFYGTTSSGDEVLIGYSSTNYYYSLDHGDTWTLGGTQNGQCAHSAEGRFVISGGTFYTGTTGTSFASVTDAHGSAVRNIVTGTL